MRIKCHDWLIRGDIQRNNKDKKKEKYNVCRKNIEL